MSSYLFVIVQQLLSSLLDLNVDQNKIKLFPVKNIKILHLVFADDVLITIRATPNSCKHLSKVVRLYSTLTGLNINKGKSAVFFPKHCPDEIKHRVCSTLEFMEGTWPIPYLGTFLAHNRLPTNIQTQIIDKSLNKINGWQKHLLSQAGKVILIKSVLNSIPLHSITSC